MLFPMQDGFVHHADLESIYCHELLQYIIPCLLEWWINYFIGLCTLRRSTQRVHGRVSNNSQLDKLSTKHNFWDANLEFSCNFLFLHFLQIVTRNTKSYTFILQNLITQVQTLVIFLQYTFFFSLIYPNVYNFLVFFFFKFFLQLIK